jgi:sortase A
MAWSPAYIGGKPSGSRTPREAIRRLRRAAGFGLLAVGLLLVAEAAVTVVWQEPFTALWTRGEQKQLAAQLDRMTPASAGPPLLASRLPEQARSLDRHTREGDPLGRIAIPKIGARFVFVQGTNTGDLEKGPGHYADTVLPGLHGTVGIAGHRTTYLAPFRNINQLKRGDLVQLRMPYGKFTYAVHDTKIVSPGDVSVLRHQSGDWLVLTACHPLYSAAKRIVVSARLSRAPRHV